MKRLSLWLPSILWMCVIFLFSSRQRVEVSPEYVLNFLFFKTLHVIEYAILFLLNYRVLRSHRTAFILTFAYAISDEIHQMFVPTREGTVRDVIIDGLGAGLAWIFLTQLLPKAPKKLREWARRLEIS